MPPIRWTVCPAPKPTMQASAQGSIVRATAPVPTHRRPRMRVKVSPSPIISRRTVPGLSRAWRVFWTKCHEGARISTCTVAWLPRRTQSNCLCSIDCDSWNWPWTQSNSSTTMPSRPFLNFTPCKLLVLFLVLFGCLVWKDPHEFHNFWFRKINYNQLDTLPKPISKLKQLRSLVLQNNQIKSIDKDAFVENVNLESIDIKESSIDSLNYNAFSNLVNLKKLWVVWEFACNHSKLELKQKILV